MSGLPPTAAFLPSPPLTDDGQGKCSHASGASHSRNASIATPPATPSEKSKSLAPTSLLSSDCPEGADTYKLGASKNAPPQVSLDECRDHLRLLGAFADLRDAVFAAARGADSSDALPPHYRHYDPATEDIEAKAKLDPRADEQCQTAWRNYLTRASHRFELWLSVILTPANLGFTPERASFAEVRFVKGKRYQTTPPTTRRIPARCLPPIDVLMMYHAYLLNPACAFEDMVRLASRQSLSGVEFPAKEVAAALDGSSHMPSLPEAQQLWDASANEPWELSLLAPCYNNDATDENLPRTGEYGLKLSCPRCKAATFFPWVFAPPYMGLAQPGWETTCHACPQKLNVDTLRGGAFIADLEHWCADANVRTKGIMFSPLDGALFPEDLAAPIFAPIFKHTTRPEDKLFAKAFARTRGKAGSMMERRPAEFARVYGWKMSEMAEAIQSHSFSAALRPHVTPTHRAEFTRRINFVLSSYVTADPLTRASLDLVSAAERQCSFVDEMAKLTWSDSTMLAEGRFEGSIARAIVRYHRWLDLMYNEKRMLVPTLDIDLAFHTHLLKRRYASDVKQHLLRFIDHNDKVEENALESAFQRTAKAWHSRYKQPYTACGCYKEPTSVSRVVSGIVSGTGSLSQRFKAAKAKNPGDLPVDAFVDAQHPSTHNAVIIQSDTSGDVARKERRNKADQEVSEGRRRANHEPAFVHGYGYTPLVPYVYVPGYYGGVGACTGGSSGSGDSSGASACCGMASCGGASGSIGCGGGASGGCGGGSSAGGGGCGGGGGGGCGGGGGGGGCGGGGGGC